MFSLKTHAIISDALFATVIVTAMVGSALHDNGALSDSSAT